MKSLIFSAILCVACSSHAQSDEASKSPASTESAAAVAQSCHQLARNALGRDKLRMMLDAAGSGIQMRIAAEDGREFAASTDQRSDRINVRIENQKVVSAHCG